MGACACEIAVCLILGFPFIFCCHPCVKGGCDNCTLGSQIQSVNSNHFHGRQVFIAQGGQVFVDVSQLGDVAAVSHAMEVG